MKKDSSGRRHFYYILNGRTPVPATFAEWANAYSNDGGITEGPICKKVAHTAVAFHVAVSTVFMGLDHSWGQGPPLIFETMIFGGPHDGYQERYSTWEQAEAGHLRAVELATPELSLLKRFLKWVGR